MGRTALSARWKNEGEGRTAAPRFFSAALCPAGAPVAPVQYFFNLAPPVQDLPAEDIVWKRAVAPVLAQCPATDLQQACHFPVTQIFILFWQIPPSLERPSITTDSRSMRS